MHGALRRPAALIALLAALAIALTLAACGGEADEHEVVGGEAARLGELEYHVQRTRFLNHLDADDQEYLVGQPPPPSDESYLGAFLRVDNDSDDEDLRSASDYTLVDIRGNRFEPLEPEGPFAFEIGGRVAAGSQLPPPDSIAATGPTAGGVLLFLVDAGISQRLPLSLEIAAEGETATVQLDI